MVHYNDFGWVFIYVFVFGMNDLFIKKYIKTDFMYFSYYLCVVIVGLYLLFSTNLKEEFRGIWSTENFTEKRALKKRHSTLDTSHIDQFNKLPKY